MNPIIGACIIVTSIVVTVAGGIYISDEIDQRRVEREETERLDGARAEIFKFARAKPGDESKVRAFCGDTDELIENASADTESLWRQIQHNCRAFGYL